jgi:hypothetical protein
MSPRIFPNRTRLKPPSGILVYGMMALTFAFAVASNGQESLISIGRVYQNGAFAGGVSPISAATNSSRNALGSYNITIESPGAFAGAAESDFVVETSMEYVNSDDRGATAVIESVTADLLTVRVKIADLENTTFPDLAAAADANFTYLVRRIDELGNGEDFSSRHLVATGTVRSSGLLDSGFGVGGISILTGKGNPGGYFIRLSKPAGFTADSSGHYVLLLSPRNTSVPDVAVRGGTFNANSDDYVDFYVKSDDVQQATAANAPVPADTSFAFAIFNPGHYDSTGESGTNLLKVVASVDGASGNLVLGKAAYPGATITASKSSEGRYDVFVDAPGAFAGVADSSLAAFVSLNMSNLVPIDELAKTRVAVVNANRIRIDVAIDDVQHPNDEDGIPSDGSFFVSVYDAAPILHHDLRVSKKSSGTGARGAGVFNGSGTGQSQKLRLKGKAPRSAFYRSSNSGSSLDSLHLKSGKISSSVKANFFVTSGARRNITASVKSGAMVESNLYPNESIAIQGTFRYRNLVKRPKAKVFLRSLSGYQPANQDTNQVSLKAG